MVLTPNLIYLNIRLWHGLYRKMVPSTESESLLQDCSEHQHAFVQHACHCFGEPQY